VLFNSTLTNNGTPLTFAGGSDSTVDTIVFDQTGQGWYTDSGSGGVGNFGKININFTNDTYTTTRTMTNVPAAHGAAYDPYTGTIILMGSNHISQVNPYTGGTSLLADMTLTGTYDQGAVDGQGHIFAANNNGTLTFIDISGSGSLATPTFETTLFLANSLDDVAPLSGLGSLSVSAPEPSTLATALLGVTVGLVAFWRNRRATA
jgi:hypothetical protein